MTVMGKVLEPGGVASEELVDRCRTAARVMGELEGALVIPTGGDPAMVGISEAEVMREAEQTKTRLKIVTSAYHLPYTAWLFRQVAAALKMDIQLESKAATGAGAYDSFNIGKALFMAKNIDDQSMRKELLNFSISVNDDFIFEKKDIVIREMLPFCE